jgi:hypothetical protein
MVHSRRRTSLLGILGLLAGAVALALTRFNPTGIETVPNLPVTLKLSVAAAIVATALALIAFLAAASSRRTGTGVPLFAILLGGAALVLAFKPHLLTRPPATAAARPTPVPSAQPSVQTSPPADSDGEHRVKTIFDSDYPSSTPDVKPTAPHSNSPDSPVAPAPPVARPDPAVALRAARANVEAARENVLRSIESTPAYRAAKADADAADTDLKKARLTYDPGSPELIAASQAALEAHSRLQKLVYDAAAHDPPSQDAERQLKAAQSVR